MELKTYIQSIDGEKIVFVGPLFEPEHPESYHFKENTIFIDGGTRFKEDMGFSVGDGDSFTGELDKTLPKEKDYSDLAFALNNIPIHTTRLFLLGFLGGRKDHELINFGEVYNLLSKRAAYLEVHFDKEIVGYTCGTNEHHLKGTFSVMALHEGEIKITGDCKYEVSEQTAFAPLSSNLLSNEAEGTVIIESTVPYFILNF